MRRGLLKLVFATGTLAAGINMPARTTIIGALGRKTDDGYFPLPHNELLQVCFTFILHVVCTNAWDLGGPVK